jgi:AcrR family transcriptional regulator
MESTRALNMQKRRETILAQARRVIVEQGFDALNLRDLAQDSGVTVPTIYNLIGNKEELLKALTMGALENYEAELGKKLPCPASALPELMADTFLQMISANQKYHRATVLANEGLEIQQGKPGDFGFRRVQIRKIVDRLFLQSLEEGLLRGDIDRAALVEQVVVNHQVAFRDWAHRIISLPAFYKQSLAGFYVALAADAVESYRSELAARLSRL